MRVRLPIGFQRDIGLLNVGCLLGILLVPWLPGKINYLTLCRIPVVVLTSNNLASKEVSELHFAVAQNNCVIFSIFSNIEMSELTSELKLFFEGVEIKPCIDGQIVTGFHGIDFSMECALSLDRIEAGIERLNRMISDRDTQIFCMKRIIELNEDKLQEAADRVRMCREQYRKTRSFNRKKTQALKDEIRRLKRGPTRRSKRLITKTKRLRAKTGGK